MKRPVVLITWELGGGLGHLVRLARIGERLHADGARLIVASRDVAAAQRWFPHSPCISAPLLAAALAYPNAGTLAEVFVNIGLGEIQTARALSDSWGALIGHIAPDVMVMDFSPSALLASQRYSCRRVLIDNGYSYAVPGQALPSLRPWQPSYRAFHHTIERRVLSTINTLMSDWEQPELNQVSDLYGRVDDVHLMTLPELDHTGFKPGRNYRGYLAADGELPSWPDSAAGHKRLLVVLKPLPGLVRILHGLAEAGLSIVAVVPGLDPEQQRSEHKQLIFASGWIDPGRAAAQADAVLCAGGDITGIALLAGCAVAVVPCFEEQRLTALKAVETGAARLLEPDAPDQEWIDCVDKLLADPDYTHQARRLATRHQGLVPEQQLDEMIVSMTRGVY